MNALGTSEAIKVGEIGIRFLIGGEQSAGTVAVFEFSVPAGARVAAAHSHDGYDETIYGIDGVLTWTVDGTATEVARGRRSGSLAVPCTTSTTPGRSTPGRSRSSRRASSVRTTSARSLRSSTCCRRSARSRRDRRSHGAPRPHAGAVTTLAAAGVLDRPLGAWEPIVRDQQREIWIVLARKELTITQARYAPGQRVAGAHVHHGHTDAFYVLEGELAFVIGRERELVTISAGGFVAAPPGVAHSVRTQDDRAAGWLTIHAHDGGFAAFMRGLRDGVSVDWDIALVPTGGGRPASDAIVRRGEWSGRLRLDDQVESGHVALAQRTSRRRRQDARVNELLDRRRRERGRIGEEIPVPRARAGDVDVARRVDDDVATPRPRAARVLEHRQQQQVLEPHHRKVAAALDGVDRRGLERRPARSATSTYRERFSGFGFSGLIRSWYLTSTARIPCVPSSRSSDERRVERAQAVEVRRVEPPGRVREPDLAHRARARPATRRARPGRRARIGREIAEQVERERRRRQQVGPQPLVVEALVRLDERRSRPRSVERAGGDEVRARLARVLERQAAPDRPHRLPRARGLIGCDPIGWPCASRHCAWCSASRRRNAVIAGRPGTTSSASQHCAASSSAWLGDGGVEARTPRRLRSGRHVDA